MLHACEKCKWLQGYKCFLSDGHCQHKVCFKSKTKFNPISGKYFESRTRLIDYRNLNAKGHCQYYEAIETDAV